jgi:hypothetical protein
MSKGQCHTLLVLSLRASGHCTHGASHTFWYWTQWPTMQLRLSLCSPFHCQGIFSPKAAATPFFPLPCRTSIGPCALKEKA